MALKLPSFKFLANADAKSRVFLVFTVVVLLTFGVVFATRFFNRGESTTGASKVAAPPAGLQSVPGGQLSPEYYRALMQANTQAAQKAQISGGSAVPTMVNIPDLQAGFSSPQQNCTVLCPNEENANVENDITNLVKSGKLAQKDADLLLNAAKNNVPVDEYAAMLDDLVKQGKLTPEQARQLLEQYKKQHQHLLTANSAEMMDGLIKAGQLPLDTANQLLALQKNGITPADYANELNRLVAEGKISPQTAARLLAQYTHQQAQEATKQDIFKLKQLAKAGAITPEVAQQLTALQTKNVPLDQYAAELQRLVAAGKITPAEAAKLLAEYKARRASLGGGVTSALDDLIGQQEKLGSPNLAALKAERQRLLQLQANNATPTEYANELKRAVQAGLLPPEVAARLMQAYQALAVPQTAAGPYVQTDIPTTADFAKLQQAVQTQAAAPENAGLNAAQAAQFEAAKAQAEQQAMQNRADRIQQIETAMSNQAQTLLTAWQPIKMEHKAGTPASTFSKSKEGSLFGKRTGSSENSSDSETDVSKAPLVKAGTIYFGVLDTAVDSDYPDTPVMVTIVEGPLKGAKLLGKLALAQGQDRVSLTFNLMNKDNWNNSKTVNAFAIDPDTARTVMASHVNYHYMLRYGSLFASSFLSGYASGIQQEGSSTTGIFGTSSTHPGLSPGNKIAVALGQVGNAFSTAAQTYVNTPPTVKINSGVGLGILFMANVT